MKSNFFKYGRVKSVIEGEAEGFVFHLVPSFG